MVAGGGRGDDKGQGQRGCLEGDLQGRVLERHVVGVEGQRVKMARVGCAWHVLRGARRRCGGAGRRRSW